MSDQPVTPPFDARMDQEAGIGIVRFSGRVTGQEMIGGAAALFALPGWNHAFDVIWDCSRVEAHVLSPGEVGPLVDEVTDNQEGHDALIESQIAREEMLGDLLVRFIRRRGKSASSHADMDGALRTLGRDALPASLR